VSLLEKVVYVGSWLAKNAVAGAWGQFGNLKDRENLPLEAITRGLVKSQQTKKI
jgi:hypothetical protein